MGTAPNVTKMRGYVEMNIFSMEQGKCVKVWKNWTDFLKNNTDLFPHLYIYIQVAVLERSEHGDLR